MASGLCLFCLRHPANADCYDKGGPSKPACSEFGCKGKHAESVHDILGGVSASVSLLTNEGSEYEDDMYVNVARAGDEDGEWQDTDDLWLELEAGESEDEGGSSV